MTGQRHQQRHRHDARLRPPPDPHHVRSRRACWLSTLGTCYASTFSELCTCTQYQVQKSRGRCCRELVELRRRWLCSGTVPVRCGRGTRLPGAGVRPTVASVLALVAGRPRRCAVDAMAAACNTLGTDGAVAEQISTERWVLQRNRLFACLFRVLERPEPMLRLPAARAVLRLLSAGRATAWSALLVSLCRWTQPSARRLRDWAHNHK